MFGLPFLECHFVTSATKELIERCISIEMCRNQWKTSRNQEIKVFLEVIDKEYSVLKVIVKSLNSKSTEGSCWPFSCGIRGDPTLSYLFFRLNRTNLRNLIPYVHAYHFNVGKLTEKIWALCHVNKMISIMIIRELLFSLDNDLYA